MIKCIFSDMDGTLLDENGKVPKSFGTMLADLKKRGCRFVATSGRQYSSLANTLKEYKEDILLISDNGACASIGDRELFCKHMDKDIALEIIRRVDAMPEYIKPVVAGRINSYVRNEWIGDQDEFGQYNTEVCMVDSFGDIDEDIVKISVSDRKYRDSEKNIYSNFSDINGVKMLITSAMWVDFMSVGVSKGTAIRELQSVLGVDPAECAAFGDYLNDMDMMDAVGYSFAMENAHPELAKKAKFRCKPNKENGVVEKIYELLKGGEI